MKKELFDELINSAGSDTVFDFIANNEHLLRKEEVSRIALELAYSYTEALRYCGNSSQKVVKAEVAEYLIERLGEDDASGINAAVEDDSTFDFVATRASEFTKQELSGIAKELAYGFSLACSRMDSTLVDKVKAELVGSLKERLGFNEELEEGETVGGLDKLTAKQAEADSKPAKVDSQRKNGEILS